MLLVHSKIKLSALSVSTVVISPVKLSLSYFGMLSYICFYVFF